MSKKGSFTSKDRYLRKLLVEGADDANVCYHLLKSHYIAVKERDTKKARSSDIEVAEKNGVENLLASLQAEL
jgi:hypothetical protein